MQPLNLSTILHSEAPPEKKKEPWGQKFSDVENKVDKVFKETLSTPPTTPPTTPEKKPLAPIYETDSPNTKLYKSIVNQHPTPEKKIPLTVEANGRIAVDLSPDSKKAANLIYRYKHEPSGKVLIGKTEVEMRKRLSGYVRSFNSERAPDAHLKLPTAVRKNPEQFTFGILKSITDEEDIDLGKLEDAYIVHRDAIKHGYNERRGGAGAKKRKSLTEEDIEKLHKMVPTLLRQDSPADFAKFLKKDGGVVRSDMAPEMKKEAASVYCITEYPHDITECTADTLKKYKEDEKKRYFGKTEGPLGHRFSTHLHLANHPENPKADAPLYKKLRKHPERFKVDIRMKLEVDKDLLEPVEALFIKRFDSVKKGFNRNRGAFKLLEKHNLLPKD